MTIEQYLNRLESTGFIRLVQTHPELEYLFRHALVQDAAYESLLMADRQGLHLRVAETLERLYPDQLDEVAPVLGHHFVLGDDDKRALKYFTLAGDVAFGVNANAEATTHYGRAIKIARNQADFPIDQLIHLFTRRGRALELLSHFDEAEANYKDLEDLAGTRKNRALELAGLMARATIYAIPSPAFNPERGETLCRQTLDLAQQLADRPAEAKILWTLMLLHFFTGRMEEGLEYGEQSLALARAFNLKEQLAYTLNDLAGYYYLPAGKHKQGQAVLTEARMIWQDLDNRAMLADNQSTSAFHLFFFGDLEQAHTLSNEAYHISQTTANLWGQAYSHTLTGMVEAEWGQVQQAIKTLEEAIVLAEQAGFLAGQVISGAILAIQYTLLGDFKRGLALAQKTTTIAESQIDFWQFHALGSLALTFIRQSNLTAAAEILQQVKIDPAAPNKFVMSYILALMATCELGLAQGEYHRIITLLDHHLADLRRRHIYTYLPYLLYYQAQALLGQNQADQALETLSEARTLAENLGSKHILWPILVSLSQIETNSAKVQRLRQQARETLEYIADHTPPEFQRKFLNLPSVQKVLND